MGFKLGLNPKFRKSHFFFFKFHAQKALFKGPKSWNLWIENDAPPLDLFCFVCFLYKGCVYPPIPHCTGSWWTEILNFPRAEAEQPKEQSLPDEKNLKLEKICPPLPQFRRRSFSPWCQFRKCIHGRSPGVTMHMVWELSRMFQTREGLEKS